VRPDQQRRVTDRGFYFDLVPAPLAGSDQSPTLDLKGVIAAAVALPPDNPATEDATLLIEAFIASAAHAAIAPLVAHDARFTAAELVQARHIAAERRTAGAGPARDSRTA